MSNFFKTVRGATLTVSKKFTNITHLCLAIDCQWDEWVYGECSKICGNGTRTNTRVKLIDEENGGTCDGNLTEIEECNTNSCPGLK